MNLVHFFPTNFLQRAQHFKLDLPAAWFYEVIFLSDDCCRETLTTRMEGIGKRYTFLMRVLGKMYNFFDGRELTNRNIFLRETARQKQGFWRERTELKVYFFKKGEVKFIMICHMLYFQITNLSQNLNFIVALHFLNKMTLK